MNINKIDMKDIPWKALSSMATQILFDTKVLLCIASFGFIIYFIGYDTVLKPSLKEIEIRDTALKNQAEQSRLMEEQIRQYQMWEQQLKGLETTVVKLGANDAPTVEAAKQSNLIKDLASGKKRSPDIPLLPAPHDVLQQAAISQKEKLTVSIVAAPSPMGGLEGSRPGGPGGAGIGAPNENGGPPPSMTEPGGTPANVVSLERYDFEVKVTGTYPGLADFVNQLVSQRTLVVIRSIQMKPSSGAAAEFRPDPNTTPDAPVKIDLTMLVSVYLDASAKTL